jgi:Histidine kinase-, DNA gyrase B-, and HSP90-like ATPase
MDSDLRVSTHKSLIKTLGRQYTDAAQFFVELLVNSWMWGEATRVEIRIPENGSSIEYEEWGNGMDLADLREFLTKGKLTEEGFSHKYKRPIRESYGMGSLAWLTVGRELELQVHKGRFDRTIMLTENLIDRTWDATDQSTWRPIRLVQAPLNHDGLRIRIRSLTKKPDPADVRRALLARANVLALRGYGPFEVTVNEEHVKPEELRGATLLPVSIATEYGRITGEIMITPISRVRAGVSEAGISVQQKHITCLQHQFFGLDHYRTQGLSRIQGWVNADFLRRLPGGNDFEHDSAQWRVFEKAMRGFVKNKVYKTLRQSASRRELRSIQYLNHEIAERLRRSLRKNIQVLSREIAKARPVPTVNAVPGKTRKEIVLKERKHRKAGKRSREATRSVIHLKDQILAFDVAHGGDRGQAYVEADKNGVRTVYVNMDHPMWEVEANLTPTKLRYCIRQILERSIAEEILPVNPSTPEETFSTLDSLYNDALA